jgi:hypothetical protein
MAHATASTLPQADSVQPLVAVDLVNGALHAPALELLKYGLVLRAFGGMIHCKNLMPAPFCNRIIVASSCAFYETCYVLSELEQVIAHFTRVWSVLWCEFEFIIEAAFMPLSFDEGKRDTFRPIPRASEHLHNRFTVLDSSVALLTHMDRHMVLVISLAELSHCP